jgi:hypothetical protein
VRRDTGCSARAAVPTHEVTRFRRAPIGFSPEYADLRHEAQEREKGKARRLFQFDGVKVLMRRKDLGVSRIREGKSGSTLV